jgi:AhpD family alkylhydroperoxidase
MKLDDRTIRLIAVGASITANCQPCLRGNIAKALEMGADEREISEAIDVGKMVRAGAASQMDKFVSGFQDTIPSLAVGWDDRCGCDSFVATIVGGSNG